MLARICDGVEDRELSRDDRAATIAAWRAPVPPGLSRVHASWLDTARDTGTPDVDVWLARSAYADIPPMDGGPDDALGWLAAIGAEQVAFALGDAAATADSQLVRDAAARVAERGAAGMGSRRAAIARCRVDAGDDLRFPRIGARAIAAQLDAVAARRLVLRMPRAIGLAIASELRAYSSPM